MGGGVDLQGPPAQPAGDHRRSASTQGSKAESAGPGSRAAAASAGPPLRLRCPPAGPTAQAVRAAAPPGEGGDRRGAAALFGPNEEEAPGEPGPLPSAPGGIESPKPGPGTLGPPSSDVLNTPEPKGRGPFGTRSVPCPPPFQVDCSWGWRLDARPTCRRKVTFLARRLRAAPLADPAPSRFPLATRARRAAPEPLTHAARGDRRYTGGRRGWRAPRP